jgi:transposase-like protein
MIKEVMFLYGIGYKDLVHAISTNVRVSAFIIDATVVQIASQHFWLWICIEPIDKSVLGIYISEEKHACC